MIFMNHPLCINHCGIDRYKKMMLGKPDDMKFGRQIFGGYQIKVMVEIKRTDILRKTCWSLMDKDEYK